MDLHRFNSPKNIFVPNMTTAEAISIAPGEGKEPTSILNEKCREELAFYLVSFSKENLVIK